MQKGWKEVSLAALLASKKEIRPPVKVRILQERGISIDYLASLLHGPTYKKGLPKKISALKKDDSDIAKEIGRGLALYKDNYHSAKEKRDRRIVRKWNKINYEDVVCADSKALPGALAKLTSQDDTLYIMGHCSPGQQTLQSLDGKHKVTGEVSVQDLIEILNGKLDRKFAGKIKIFACQSAKKDTKDSGSFAETFATKLSKAGWVNCRFYGYTEKLSVFQRDVRGHKLTQEGKRAKDFKEFIQVPTQHAS